MTRSTEQMRNWNGPAILGFGFRPFFLLAAIWAVLAMAIWVAMLSGHDILGTRFDPVAWHAHEMLFGYLGAVIAGFLLTAVPNWTGSLPVVGWPLARLAGLWLLGRAAIALSAHMPPLLVLLGDLALPIALAAFLGREILSGHNWRNLPVLALLGGWIAANGLFHYQAATQGAPAQAEGLRAGVAVALMLIALIGGRIIPSFTRNWLAQRDGDRLPVPFNRGDGAVLALSAAALALWTLWPQAHATVALCGLTGLAQLWRMSRWQGHRTGAEPLVWVLHAAYAFVPLGFLGVAASGIFPGATAAALHLWLAGAIGLMTLAVMTRASLGHSGRALHASWPVAALYLAVIAAVLARWAAGFLPGDIWPLHLAAAAWMLGYGGFAILFWPVLTRPRLQGQPRKLRPG